VHEEGEGGGAAAAAWGGAGEGGVGEGRTAAAAGGGAGEGGVGEGRTAAATPEDVVVVVPVLVILFKNESSFEIYNRETKTMRITERTMNFNMVLGCS
jgi:hypothetical protein